MGLDTVTRVIQGTGRFFDRIRGFSLRGSGLQILFFGRFGFSRINDFSKNEVSVCQGLVAFKELVLVSQGIWWFSKGTGFGFSRDWWFSKELVSVLSRIWWFSKGTGSGFSSDPDFFQQELDLKTASKEEVD